MIMAQLPQSQNRPPDSIGAGGGGGSSDGGSGSSGNNTATTYDTDDRMVGRHREPVVHRTTGRFTSTDQMGIKQQNEFKTPIQSTKNVVRIAVNSQLGITNINNMDKENQRPNSQSQDGKRSLIKNQLYLIEQLQLENANLRNERDQLQLENEELKFQLQMISSSNILSQSGATFNDRHHQLNKLVDQESRLNNNSNNNNNEVTAPGPLEYQPTDLRPNSCIPANHPAATTAPIATAAAAVTSIDNQRTQSSDVTSNSGLARITATPLRQPRRLFNAVAEFNGTSNNKFAQRGQLMGFIDVNKAASNQPNPPALESIYATSGGGGGGGGSRPLVGAPILPATTMVGGGFQFSADSENATRLLGSKSSSMGVLNVNRNLNAGPNLLGQDVGSSQVGAQDDDEQRLRAIMLIKQRYEGDFEKVQAAAVVIQRAFRKYQICKRFRTITEQLRHTCQSSSVVSSMTAQQQQQGDRTTTITTSKRDTTNGPASAGNSEEQQGSVPYVFGTTRLAAWESLSYAASRLAASAAAATANTKQALVNGVTKSASSLQVSASTTNLSTAGLATTKSSNSSGSVATTTATTTATNGVISERSLKSDPVVAAAINFQQLESIRKRQYRVGLNIFNKNPEKGISFLIAHSFIDASPPYAKNSPSYYLSNQLHFIDKQQHLAHQQSAISLSALNACSLCTEEENLKRNVAHFLLHRKGLAKEKIGQYLGNLQAQFNQDVLRYYLQELDFHGLQIDIALRKFSATLRLPGEAQKIERFVDCFAQRYVQCQQQLAANNATNLSNLQTNTIQLTSQTNHGQVGSLSGQNLPRQNGKQSSAQKGNQTTGYKNHLTLLSKDEIFILTFAIIMLNTDLHSPSLKPTSRMSASQFVHNLRGVFSSQMINESDLIEIYERVKANQITTTPDHVTHVMKVQQGLTTSNFQKKELPNLCVPHRRLVCFCRLFEVYDVNKKERVGQHQREIFLFNDLLLVTKLARRARANTAQQYIYRQSIPLQGLYVQLFQSTHYNFGLRLCRRSNDETLIMFNARNELDQSRFVDDLSESIAEMDEMETIRAHNVIDTIHFKQQDKLRRHALMHNNSQQSDNIINQKQSMRADQVIDRERTGREDRSGGSSGAPRDRPSRRPIDHDNSKLPLIDENQNQGLSNPGDSEVRRGRRQSKSNSMSNLSSVGESKNDDNNNNNNRGSSSTSGLPSNRSLQQHHHLPNPRGEQQRSHNDSSGAQRSCSSGSIHSLDSGLFLSRDISPNQSS